MFKSLISIIKLIPWFFFERPNYIFVVNNTNSILVGMLKSGSLGFHLTSYSFLIFIIDMISIKTLRELIDQKLKDAEALINKKRYSTAIYILGYAIEVALKLKICKLLKFSQGFPENKTEFGIYQNNAKTQNLLYGAIVQLKDIKHHDLNKLLFYSGVEYQIKLNYLAEWNLIVDWNPDMRYKIQKFLKKDALEKANATKLLIQNIL